MKRLGVLYSGGKDSTLSLFYARNFCNVKCLITLVSKNPFSYMFHTPNIELVALHAKAMKIPITMKKTKGKKEEELKDLKRAIVETVDKYKINGIVSGALASVYQASRIQRICNELKLECFNPLWQKDQLELLNDIVRLRFNVIITGVFVQGLSEFLGKEINETFIEKVKKLQKECKINPAGEGGEFETFVLDTPFFKKRIKVVSSHIKNQEVFIINKAVLVDKNE